MKSIFYNAPYFLREAKTIMKLNLLSNIFSLLSTALIFFILALVISGGWISSEVGKAIQGEAEISIYYNDDITEREVLHIVDSIKSLKEVKDARMVDAQEAYNRMVEILGKEAGVLELFEDNPFSSFIEVSINLEEMDAALQKLALIPGIEHIRDNREVLERISDMAGVLKLIGYLVLTAAGISTLVIISHMIRLGIYNNREQINTLRLLGAPEAFIAVPFLLQGLLLTLGGGILASLMIVFLLKKLYAHMAAPLHFIPLPSLGALLSWLIPVILLSSIMLGLMSSMMGINSQRSK